MHDKHGLDGSAGLYNGIMVEFWKQIPGYEQLLSFCSMGNGLKGYERGFREELRKEVRYICSMRLQVQKIPRRT